MRITYLIYLIFYLYIRFPKGDIGRLWVNAVQQYQPNFLPNQRSIICSLHFLSTDYIPSIVSRKLMLNKMAVPNLSMATNIESEQSEVSVEEIKVTMDDVLSKSKYLQYFVLLQV